jgi:uracil-DNA glycosylase family 4
VVDGVRLPHPITGELFTSPVEPGTGWPDDPVGPPSVDLACHEEARDEPCRMAETPLKQLSAEISVCRRCPRLVAWREQVAVEKRASYADEPYWGRPIAGWGSDHPRVLIVGLAPAAHGGNRTGRIFTGDRSGDWLFASLHRVGLAAQETSVHAGDGQRLIDTRMVAAVRCAPPLNKPTTEERDTCAPWLDREVALIADTVRVVVALGSFGWDAALRTFAVNGYDVPRPKPRFGHGARVDLDPSRRLVPRLLRAGQVDRRGELDGPQRVTLLGCYHPSQQNTFTGKLTTDMLDAVLGDAARLSA